jgi:hypothetical protein
MVFDLTEGAEFLSGSGTDSLFLGAIDDSHDGATGSITGFAVEHLDWGTRGVSADPPVPIPDVGEAVFALAPLPLTGIAGRAAGGRPGPAAATVARGVYRLEAGAGPAHLLDGAGRQVMELAPGRNDVRHLGPGVYFVRPAAGRDAAGVTKVVIQR